MPKPYTGEEIKSFLKEELKKTKHIMTFGTIGSCYAEKDIDIIITKKPDPKSSDFFKEIHEIYDKLSEYLNKRYGVKAVRFHNITDESYLTALGVFKEKDLKLHTMLYSSLPQAEIDWTVASTRSNLRSDIRKRLRENYDCLIGSPEKIFTKPFSEKRIKDSDFNFIYHADKTSSQLPEKILIKFMNNMFNHIFEKLLDLKPENGTNKNEIRKIFYRACDIIDKQNL